MKQYWQIKSLHKDKILLFRMGDFYEMFDEDAKTAAPILNITLTSRNKKSLEETKMCGVPHHSVAGPVSKLLSAGFKVAICDQVGTVSSGRTLMERKVTRVLTPGMVYDPESLDRLKAHYLCAFDNSSVSFVDVSTGTAFFYRTSSTATQRQLMTLLNPVELVLTSEQKHQHFNDKKWGQGHISVFDESPSPIDSQADSPLSVQRILAYIKEQQGETALKTIQAFQQKYIEQILMFSPQAVEHLEVFKNYQGEAGDTLFSAINRTKTPPGSRLLRSRLQTPGTNQDEIEKKLDSIEKWQAHPEKIERIREKLAKVGDIERRLGKLSHERCSAGDLISLSESLQAGWEALSLSPSVPEGMISIAQEISRQITQTINSTATTSHGGGIIRKGVSEKLDQLMEEIENQQVNLRKLEDMERRETGIPSLKIRYNNIFSYYIEVTKLHSQKVPAHYVRKQTLTQAERYTTQKLQVIEGKILSHRVCQTELEKQIFENLRQNVLKHWTDLFHIARFLSEMDVSVALAYLAIERSYVRPQFSSEGTLVLVNSRHPVVEQKQGCVFVPNTIRLQAGECLLLTGPNMAGKSTLMRQVALSAILAQAGCFVPAEQALLPLFTKLFTRIGASDSLSKGLSTFMVEMKESVEIIQQADAGSLIILDEIGRGTATYDGMSLAQAMLEYLVDKKKSIIFFATHYRELTLLGQTVDKIRNAHLNVEEKAGKIRFLYTLVSGCANDSYGVYVAELAGFPKSVVERAKQLLKSRESQQDLSLSTKAQNRAFPSMTTDKKPDTWEALVQQIQAYPLQGKTPLETMGVVEKWKQEIKRKTTYK